MEADHMEDINRIQEMIDRSKDAKKTKAILENERHSPHARWMWVNGKLVKFHMTKRRPWVKKTENRRRNKMASASRKKNR